MKFNDKGELIFSKTERIPLLTMYQIKEKTPTEIIMEPKFKKCSLRAFEGRIKPCKQVVFKWTCSETKMLVNLKICENCNVAEEKRNPVSIN